MEATLNTETDNFVISDVPLNEGDNFIDVIGDDIAWGRGYDVAKRKSRSRRGDKVV